MNAIFPPPTKPPMPTSERWAHAIGGVIGAVITGFMTWCMAKACHVEWSWLLMAFLVFRAAAWGWAGRLG